VCSMNEQAGRPFTREEAAAKEMLVDTLRAFIVEHARPSQFDDGTADDYIHGYRGALGDLEYTIDRALRSTAWRDGAHLT